MLLDLLLVKLGFFFTFVMDCFVELAKEIDILGECLRRKHSFIVLEIKWFYTLMTN